MKFACQLAYNVRVAQTVNSLSQIHDYKYDILNISINTKILFYLRTDINNDKIRNLYYPKKVNCVKQKLDFLDEVEENVRPSWVVGTPAAFITQNAAENVKRFHQCQVDL